MRRTPRGNQGSAASLFPFLAVLLCTMGAMVVLLVAMAHVAREKAEQQAEAQAAAARAADTPEQQLARQRLVEAQTYRDRLGEVRSQVATRLDEEQTKLTGIEDHIRRLQDEVEILRTEAMELIALEEEHYDDQAMAEQELKRLKELTQMLTDEIVELEEQAAGRQRRYAIVPMRDEATGTHRPAVYFECRADGVILQPEGIRLTREDFLPPVHVSSPLAAAVRTVNQFYDDHPEARGVGEAGSPYPLLVVRPDGISAYHAARSVLESINDEYGYQPVAEEWPLEYEAANPVLAEQVLRAIELARSERKRLAAAAPQLFRRSSTSWAWNNGRGGGGVASHGSLLGSSRGPGGDGESDNPFANVSFGSAGQADSEKQGGTYGQLNNNSAAVAGGLSSPNSEDNSAAVQSTGEPSDQLNPYASSDSTSSEAVKGGSNTEQTAASGAVAAMSEEGAAGQGASSSGDTGSVASASSSGQAQAASTQQAASASAGNTDSNNSGDSEENQRSGIPIRRSIELAVYPDQIVFPSGEAIELVGPTRTHAQQVAAALKRHADSWGIAGQGFYWKPSLVLNTTAGGQARATELTKLLRSAGIKVSEQPASTARERGGQDASQRR